MKSILSALVSVLAFAGSVSAAVPTVDITSFVAVDGANRIGEVCGKVTGVDADLIPLRVVSDYETSSPGAYSTFAPRDGVFCSLVMTLTGTVEVTLMNAGHPGTAKVRATMTRMLDR